MNPIMGTNATMTIKNSDGGVVRVEVSEGPFLTTETLSVPEEAMEPTAIDSTPNGDVLLEKADFLAGPVVFQVINPQGQRYCYQSSVRADERSPGEKVMFLRFASGGVEEHRGKTQKKFDYLGLLKPNSPNIFHNAEKSGCKKDSLTFQVAQWAINVIWSGAPIPTGYLIQAASSEPDKV